MLQIKTYTKILWLACMQAIVFYVPAQNLILNGSFENNLCLASTQTCSNHKYDSLMAYSHSFGFDANLDIMTSAYSYCGTNGATQDGIWFIGVSNGGADAFSLTLSTPLTQGKAYTLTFYDRQSLVDTAGSPVQIGISNNDSTMGTILYTAPAPKTCQWTQRSVSFTPNIAAQYITVTCPYYLPASSYWTNVDNFVLDTGNTMGVKEIKVDRYLQVFPNPATTSINITCSLQFAVCNLYDVLGNEVISTKEKNIGLRE